MGNKYVLAMYDIRGKQDFIFRTNKLQEIIGASWIIRDLFEDYLYESAEKFGKIFNFKRDDGQTSFSSEDFVKRVDPDNEENYIGEVVYEGGGNFLLLFRDMKIFKDVTYEFTKTVTEKIGTLRVLGTAIEIDGFENYPKNRKKLYSKHRINEAQESNISPWSCLPIVQVDRKTSQPLVDLSSVLSEADISKGIVNKIKKKGVNGKVSKESAVKLAKYYVEIDSINKKEDAERTKLERVFLRNEDILDNLVTEKGIDSKLAVIYIDGNNMGAKVQEITQKCKTKEYDDTITGLRSFSEETQRIYVEDGIKAALDKLNTNGDEKEFRIVVSAGDEINFIVNAHNSFDCAKNYLDYLRKQDGASACAGIAVFHSHAPYADVYRIAEEACESGKQKMKEAQFRKEVANEKGENDEVDAAASFIDFHICQGAIGTSLDEIREEENGRIISRPWLLWKESESKNSDTQIIDFEKMVKPKLKLLKEFSRTNIKGLAKAAKDSKVSLQMELNRMYSHSINEEQKKDGEKQKENKEKFDLLIKELDKDEEGVRGIIYDLALSYDLWFAGKEV